MGQKLTIEMGLACSAYGEIELPDGLDWKKDVIDWYVKWGTVFIQISGGKWIEIDANPDVSDGVDWKHPEWVQVYATESDVTHDYSEILDERS